MLREEELNLVRGGAGDFTCSAYRNFCDPSELRVEGGVVQYPACPFSAKKGTLGCCDDCISNRG